MLELEDGMTRGKVHIVEIGYVPGTDNDAAGVRIVADGFHGFTDLVDESTLIVRPGTPLIAVDMSQVTVFVGPFVPDAHAVVLQVFGVRVTFQEPQEFVYDGFQVQLFGSEAGETVVQVEAHLMSEYADGAVYKLYVWFDSVSQTCETRAKVIKLRQITVIP